MCAWTDQVRHFRNTITYRVESSDATLNSWLRDGNGDFYKGWESVNQMIKNQHNKIHTSFGFGVTILKHKFKDKNKYS